MHQIKQTNLYLFITATDTTHHLPTLAEYSLTFQFSTLHVLRPPILYYARQHNYML